MLGGCGLNHLGEGGGREEVEMVRGTTTTITTTMVIDGAAIQYMTL